MFKLCSFVFRMAQPIQDAGLRMNRLEFQPHLHNAVGDQIELSTLGYIS